jgi:hypothetical protein
VPRLQRSNYQPYEQLAALNVSVKQCKKTGLLALLDLEVDGGTVFRNGGNYWPV